MIIAAVFISIGIFLHGGIYTHSAYGIGVTYIQNKFTGTVKICMTG
jgi:hypothetical protein